MLVYEMVIKSIIPLEGLNNWDKSRQNPLGGVGTPSIFVGMMITPYFKQGYAAIGFMGRLYIHIYHQNSKGIHGSVNIHTYRN